MVCFVNVASVDRIIFSIFNGFKRKVERPHPSTLQLDVTPHALHC